MSSPVPKVEIVAGLVVPLGRSHERVWNTVKVDMRVLIERYEFGLAKVLSAGNDAQSPAGIVTTK